MLNQKAREIFLYIVRCGRERGFPPTLREIGEEFGITSTNGVRYYLGVLEREGYVKRSGRISRGMEVNEAALKRFTRLHGSPGQGHESAAGTGIPILGRVAAGSPLLATENVEGQLDLDDSFPSSEPRFALRVKGDSMRDAGILDGDLVVVRRADNAENGDVVVALLGDEATVKSYERHPDRVVLHPANPSYKAITVRAAEELRILGVVIGLVRPRSGVRGRVEKSV
jgi:repressor LexA